MTSTPHTFEDLGNGILTQWRNELGQLHREDGPAAEKSTGMKAWWLNGKCHREDGPAWILSNGETKWLLVGMNISNRPEFEEWLKSLIAERMCEMIAVWHQRCMSPQSLHYAAFHDRLVDLIIKCNNLDVKTTINSWSLKYGQQTGSD